MVQGATNLLVNTTKDVKNKMVYANIQLPPGYKSPTINFMPIIFQNV